MTEEFNWDEEVTDSTEKKKKNKKVDSTEETVLKEEPIITKSNLQQKSDEFRHKFKTLRDEYREELISKGMDVDVEVLYLPGVREPRGYIVRSMTLEDIDIVEEEVIKELEDELERRKQVAKQNKEAESKAFVTEADRDTIYTELVVSKFTIYPEDFSEKVRNKKARAGDVSEIYKTIMSLSGYMPAIYEMDEETTFDTIQNRGNINGSFA